MISRRQDPLEGFTGGANLESQLDTAWRLLGCKSIHKSLRVTLLRGRALVVDEEV